MVIVVVVVAVVVVAAAAVVVNIIIIIIINIITIIIIIIIIIIILTSLSSSRQRGLKAQGASLRTWTRGHEQGASDRGRLAGKLGGQPPEGLLLNRPRPLPALQNHRGPSFGPESDFPQPTQTERFFPNEAFFLLPGSLGPVDDNLMFTLRWADRQLYKPPLSIVLPPLGEGPVFRDHAGRPAQVSAHSLVGFTDTDRSQARETERLCRVAVTDLWGVHTGYHYQRPRSSRMRSGFTHIM